MTQNVRILDVAHLDDPLNLDRLPLEIRESGRAVVWHYVERDGKLTKEPGVPSDPSRHASVTDPSTWDSFNVARDTVEDGKCDGAGFVLGDGWVGVDLDKCRDPETGIIEASALALIQALNSYSEVSPSGTGVHIIVNGHLPPGRRRKGAVEMYDESRYFTLTGAHLTGTPTTIEERTAELASVHTEVFGNDGTNGQRPTMPRLTLTAVTDERLLRIANARATGRPSIGSGPAILRTMPRTPRPTWRCVTTSRSMRDGTRSRSTGCFARVASCARSGTHRGASRPMAQTRSAGPSTGAVIRTR